MVGAILCPALARHYCYLPEGAAGGDAWEGESDGEDDEKNCYQILSSVIHPLYQEVVITAQEKIPHHVKTCQDRNCAL